MVNLDNGNSPRDSPVLQIRADPPARVEHVTGVVHHKKHRISWHQARHSYLIDVGEDLEIQQVEVSDLFENQLLDPPFPKTRYFEVEIDEIHDGNTRTGSLRNIWPVRAHRKPDWHILRFRIRRGSWHITERIHRVTPSGESQWIYADDFNILFLSSGGRYDAATLAQLITQKLDTIARSITTGSRIPSEYENQQSCRTAFDNLFAEGIDGAFRDTVLYQHHAADFPGGHGSRDGQPTPAAFCARHGKAAVPAGQAPGIHVDIGEIEDLRDLSWLME